MEGVPEPLGFTVYDDFEMYAYQLGVSQLFFEALAIELDAARLVGHIPDGCTVSDLVAGSDWSTENGVVVCCERAMSTARRRSRGDWSAEIVSGDA